MTQLISHSVLGMTHLISHNLVIYNLYQSELSDERLYKEVKGPRIRALHATI